MVDLIWNKYNTAPTIPQNEVWILDEKYTGESVASKFKRVSAKLQPESNHLLFTTLDDIAWMLNLRGTDISFNPLFFSHLIFHKNDLSATLFIDAKKVEKEEIQ